LKNAIAAYYRDSAQRQLSLLGEDNPSPEVQLARTNLAAFRYKVANHKTYPLHLSWEPHLNTGQDSKVLKGIAGQNTLILSWRGSTKSTFTLEWLAMQIGIHTSPIHRIPFKVVYFSFNLEVAMLKSEQLQNIISCDAYREIFPWVRPHKKKWAHKVWSVDFLHAKLPTTEEPYTLAACGITGSAASKRSHLAIGDDIIPGPDEISNPELRAKMSRKWNSVIEPTIYDGGRAVCLATRMRPDDIFCTDFIPAKGWKVIEQSALVMDANGREQSAWGEYQHEPFAQSTEFLLKKRELDPVSFSFQYQNRIVRIGSQSIDPDWIIRGQIPDSVDRLVLGVDLSAGLKERHDYTAMVLAGYKEIDGKPRFYIIDVWRDRLMGNIEKLDAMLGIWDDWRYLCPRLDIWVESQSYQMSIAGDFVSYVINEKQIFDLGITPVGTGNKDKLQRLRGVTGLLQNRLVTFNQYARLGRLIEELTNFGSIDHEDLADAFVYALMGLRARRNISSENIYSQ
jgi:phage terminase large subunit-like protein